MSLGSIEIAPRFATERIDRATACSVGGPLSRVADAELKTPNGLGSFSIVPVPRAFQGEGMPRVTHWTDDAVLSKAGRKQLLTKPHFAPRRAWVGCVPRISRRAAETRATAGFGAYADPLQGAQVCRLLTNPHHAPKPAPLLNFAAGFPQKLSLFRFFALVSSVFKISRRLAETRANAWL